MANYKRYNYMDIMKRLTLTVKEYKQLKRAFQGGFTHSNPWYMGKIVNDVTSYDFTSSYPAVMIAEQFPMSTGEYVNITSRDQFEKYLKLYCCVFDVEFTGLESRVTFDNYISYSRCWYHENVQTANGRIVRADVIRTTVTNPDFEIIRKFYTWKSCRVGNFLIYMRNYLPRDFVLSILKLYKDKTELKGVAGKEVEYMAAKEQLNACYGMTVTDPVRPEITYTGEWPEVIPEPDTAKCIEEYNNSKNRFLSYAWGVFVTAFARYNLFTGIYECKSDYIYSDTDSIKIINAGDHETYIKIYNEYITRKIGKALTAQDIPTEMAAPMTKDGKTKPLGVWDFDGFYTRFKTLGAKRYMIEHDGVINITVSGLNKHETVPFLCDGWYYDRSGKEYNSPFDKFDDELYVPAEYTGKKTHTYIDDERRGVVYDYMGVPYAFSAPSAVHLENADYSLSIAEEFKNYCLGIWERYE